MRRVSRLQWAMGRARRARAAVKELPARIVKGNCRGNYWPYSRPLPSSHTAALVVTELREPRLQLAVRRVLCATRAAIPVRVPVYVMSNSAVHVGLFIIAHC